MKKVSNFVVLVLILPLIFAICGFSMVVEPRAQEVQLLAQDQKSPKMNSLGRVSKMVIDTVNIEEETEIVNDFIQYDSIDKNDGTKLLKVIANSTKVSEEIFDKGEIPEEKIVEEINLEEITEVMENVQEPEKVITSTVNVELTFEELDLFYRLVESESGNQEFDGRVAVANVVLNRLANKYFPNTITEVIYQKNQFSVVDNGMIDAVKPSDITIKAVEAALTGTMVVPEEVMYFCRYDVKSSWFARLNFWGQIDEHNFYS